MKKKWVLLTFMPLLLAGCDNYPDEWPNLDKPLIAQCPDLSGTYRIGSNNESGVGEHAALYDTLFRNILGSEPQRWAWETLTISGDPDKQLDITLALSPATLENNRKAVANQGEYYRKQYEGFQTPAQRWSGGFKRMTDEQYENNLMKIYRWPFAHRVLENGNDYRCKGGWLVGDRLVHDPGPDRNSPRPDYLDGIVRFGRDKDGGLVAEAVYEQQQELTLWCGDGCKGIPLGTWKMHDWRHWPAAESAWTGEVPRPWARPFSADEPFPEGDSSMARLGETRQLLTPLLPAGITIEGMLPAGEDAVTVVLATADKTKFPALFEAIERSYIFYRDDVRAYSESGDGKHILRLRLQLKPKIPDTPLPVIEQQLRELLPAAVALVSVKPSGTRFRTVVTAADDRAVSQLLRALDTAAGLRQPELESIQPLADGRREAHITFKERPR